MKQKYVKPNIIVERFVLTQSISLSCGAPGGTDFGPNHGSVTTCSWTADSIDLFISGLNGCVMGPPSAEDDFEFGAYCYNNPEDMLAIFGS